MKQFIFNIIQNHRLTNNSRESVGRGSKRSTGNGSRHESRQYIHNKNTISSLGASSCGNCSTIDCPSWWEQNTSSANGCQWQCPTMTQGYYFYCNGNPSNIILN